jgi:hypothetical protein
MRCIGRYVSDTLYVGRFPFLDKNDNVLRRYYHVPLLCRNEPLLDTKLCRDCHSKNDKLKAAKIINNRLIDAVHPSVLHGTIDTPIPEWSHIKDGAWFKNELVKGYKIEPMAKKVVLDEKKIAADLESLHDSKDMLKKMAEKYPSLSKTELSKYVIKYNKKHKVILTYVVSNKSTVVEAEELVVEKIKLSALEYYYNRADNSLYTLEYDYVGKYNSATEKID